MKRIAMIVMIYSAVFLTNKAQAQKALVASGPTNYQPCRGQWIGQCDNAQTWFENLGYSIDRITWPTREELAIRIADPEYQLFYLAAHGDSQTMNLFCADEQWPTSITATEIEEWLVDQPAVTFTFYQACNGLCQSGPETISYALTKGFQPDSAVVSFCGMDQAECLNCWNLYGFWQYDFFEALSQEETVGTAFDLAMELTPACLDCIFLEGDPDLIINPEPEPEPEPEIVYGDVYPKATYGDGVIDICDLMRVIDFALTRLEPTDWQFIRADVPTGSPIVGCQLPDQTINIFDILVIIHKILGIDNCIDNFV